MIVIINIFSVNLDMIEILTVCINAVIMIFKPVRISVLPRIRLTVGH